MRVAAATLQSPLLDGVLALIEGQGEEWLADLRRGYPVFISRDWRMGGPRVERAYDRGLLLERVDPAYDSSMPKFKATFEKWGSVYRGETLMEACFRACVALDKGPEFEVPDEFVAAINAAMQKHWSTT